MPCHFFLLLLEGRTRLIYFLIVVVVKMQIWYIPLNYRLSQVLKSIFTTENW